jgi:hypothetical protein
MDGLTREEMKEFLDPRNLVINIKLARIIGNIRKLTASNILISNLSCLHQS